jgi:hypothetical protein
MVVSGETIETQMVEWPRDQCPFESTAMELLAAKDPSFKTKYDEKYVKYTVVK